MYDRVCPQLGLNYCEFLIACFKHAKTHFDTEHTSDTLWLILSVSDRLLNIITKATIEGETIWKYYIYFIPDLSFSVPELAASHTKLPPSQSQLCPFCDSIAYYLTMQLIEGHQKLVY